MCGSGNISYRLNLTSEKKLFKRKLKGYEKMKKEKLKAIQLYAGVDTLEIRTEKEIDPKGQADFVPKECRKNNKSGAYFYKLNPDKYSGTQIYNRTAFVNAVNEMFDYLQISNATITRIDFRFDSFQNDFEELEKLNKFLIMLVAYDNHFKNCYESINPLLLAPLCIRSQNQYLEIENYNKSIEEPTGNVMNRLELRSKKLYSKANADTKDLHEFETWLKKLKKAISKTNIALLEDKLNESLIRRFAEERKHNTFTNNELFCKYQNSIFSKEQMMNLCTQLGYKNPTSQIQAYKQRKGIEFISHKNLQDYLQILESSFAKFAET